MCVYVRGGGGWNLQADLYGNVNNHIVKIKYIVLTIMDFKNNLSSGKC
jgi:hypothetical protein